MSILRPSFLLFRNLMRGRPAQAVEIGVRYGENAVSMIEAYPELTLYLVDNYKETDCPNAYARAKERLEGKVEFIIEDSVAAATQFQDDSLDYAYIDAGHTCEDVRKDISAWFPKVKKTGMLAGHDYSMESVKRAVKSFVDDKLHLFAIDDLSNAEMVDWFFIRR